MPFTPRLIAADNHATQLQFHVNLLCTREEVIRQKLKQQNCLGFSGKSRQILSHGKNSTVNFPFSNLNGLAYVVKKALIKIFRQLHLSCHFHTPNCCGLKRVIA